MSIMNVKYCSALTSNGLLHAVTVTSINFASGSEIIHSVRSAKSIAPRIPLLAVE